MKIPVQCGGPTMEDSSPTQNHNGQIGNSSGGINAGNKQSDESNQRIQYSIPGILHFIQHEWARFEMERSQWEVDRAELQARIAFLQGERKGQENLKNDLVRRIKMLEYALKQERGKFHKLKYGTELNQGDMKPPVMDEPGAPEVAVDVEAPFTSVSNISWRQGRQLLRQYLQEIGYTDTIIDVRSNRVRSLLGLNNNEESVSGGVSNVPGTGVNGNEASNKRAIENQGRQTPAKKAQPSALAEAMILETEAAVLANFDFLGPADVEMDEDEDICDELDDTQESQDGQDTQDAGRMYLDYERNAKKSHLLRKRHPDDEEGMTAEEFLNELNKLKESYKGDHDSLSDSEPERSDMTEDDGVDSTLGLGELAQLTVNNEAEAAYDLPSTKESFRKTWNAKYTLRSHFDGVRALAFHPEEPVLITASEDHTLKLWNLQKTVPAKKSASLDVEPLYTFRCHTGPVLCLAMVASGYQCFSGATDGAIHCWNLPNSNIDPYDSFESSVLSRSLLGHTDAVWGLSIQRTQLLSCSADGTVKLWSSQAVKQLATYTSEQDGAPTSVDFVRDEGDKMVAAYNSAHCVLYDLETTKPLLRLESSQDVVNSALGRQINRVVCHPTLPLTMTAHEDRHIRFFDNTTGKMVHSMVAHLDAVTSLAVDPNGLYLLSGSHDCSIRLWNLDNKTCVQEITAHRKKFDESILDVAFHPSRPYIASAGADGLAKVFV